MFKNLLSTLMLMALATNFIVAQSVGIIGAATPTGWDADTDMTQDAANPDIWTINMDFTTGPAKFRQDDEWVVNWGAETFPMGIGTQDGPDIPVAGGNYDVTLNSATGEYNFVSTDIPYDVVGIIGDATPGGWDEDTEMTQNPDVPTVWTIEITLIDGNVKFRAEDNWDLAWGGTDFPMGVAVMPGDDLPVVGGDYFITFNTATGEYNFELQTPVYASMGLIGDATPGGWDEDTEMVQNPVNPNLWSLGITLVDGSAKFRAEDNWDLAWGGTDFPMGVAVMPGDDIPVVAGEYNVTFNSLTGEYNFGSPLGIFNSIGVIGTATGLGFDGDVDMLQDPVNPDQWTLELHLTAGTIKFRADDLWTVNWGGTGFPTGTGTQDGDDIMIPFEDDYEISFNATTGEYILSPGVSWGIIGIGSPTGSWDEDENMPTLSSTEGFEWTANFTLTDGEAKFRKNDDWIANFGADTFPDGIGTQDGPNIPTTAGTYDVLLNTATGEYLFMGGSATNSLLSTKSVNVFPNPATDVLNIKVEAAELQGNVTLTIMDISGKVVRVENRNATETFAIEIGELNNGLYILQMSNDKYTIGKKFSVTK